MPNLNEEKKSLKLVFVLWDGLGTVNVTCLSLEKSVQKKWKEQWNIFIRLICMLSIQTS